MLNRKITIVVSGADEGDIESAIAEAVRHVNEGYTSGHNRNDTGAYHFDVSHDVPPEEQPS